MKHLSNEAMLIEYGIANKDARTFAQWKAAGYKVKKGSKGYQIWSRPITKEDEDGMEHQFFKKAYLFTKEQVEPVQEKHTEEKKEEKQNDFVVISHTEEKADEKLQALAF